MQTTSTSTETSNAYDYDFDTKKDANDKDSSSKNGFNFFETSNEKMNGDGNGNGNGNSNDSEKYWEEHEDPSKLLKSFFYGSSYSQMKQYEGVEYFLDGEHDLDQNLGSKICQLTGYYYLTGQAVGGLWGLVEGVQAPLLVQSPKFRWNAILNGLTSRGPFIANQFAVLAVYSCLLEYSIKSLPFPQDNMLTMKGTSNIVAPSLAGFLSGALLRSPHGVKASLMAGVLFGAFSGISAFWKDWNHRKHAAIHGHI